MAKSKQISKKRAAQKKSAVSKKSTKTKTTKKPRVTKVITPKHSKVKVKVVKDKKKKQTASNIEVVSGFERYKMIEVAAYYLAEKNNFAGNAADYWVEAEKMIDAKVNVDDAPQAPKPARSRKKDGLTIVEGIGPKIESLLVADGIQSLADLAKAKIATLSEILKKAGPRYSMHKPDTWPEQAALARDEKFDELKTLQDKLDGGRL